MTDNDVRRIEDKVDNVHLILAELKGSLSPTLEKLTEGQADNEKRIEDVARDHEKRLRSLEKFRYSAPSIGALSLAVGIIEGIYYLLHT